MFIICKRQHVLDKTTIFGTIVDRKMKNGAIKTEAKQLEEKIYTEIDAALRKKRGLKKALSDYLKYRHQSSLTVALRDRSFKLGTLFDIMYFLGLEPMQIFTDETRLNIEKLSLYELVKGITRDTLKEHIEKKHVFDEEIINHINDGDKKK